MTGVDEEGCVLEVGRLARATGTTGADVAVGLDLIVDVTLLATATVQVGTDAPGLGGDDVDLVIWLLAQLVGTATVVGSKGNTGKED